MRIVFRLAICAVALWIVWLVWMSRYEMLDDALIHLRYAAMLRTHHGISYDGVHANYGTSSLGYVTLLAGLRSISLSPLLPKIVSCMAYLALLGLCVCIGVTQRTKPSALVCVALLLILSGPMAVRWLTDGMESSLVAVAAVLMGMATRRVVHPALLFALGFLVTLLRVDISLLVAFGALLLAMERHWRRAIALAAGSAVAVVLVRLTMGHVLPDTALAKAGVPFLDVIRSAVHELAAGYSYGAGMLLLWVVSACYALWRSPQRLVVLVANAVFPALVILAAIKGQQMQSVRYVVWALLFSIVWNALAMPEMELSRRVFAGATVAVTVLGLVAWAVEAPIFRRIAMGRSETFLRMRAAHLDRLSGMRGVAADVGFIGYFTGADICDPNGLVNGRAAALESFDQRTAACMAARPDFAFLSGVQLGYLDYMNGMQSTRLWDNCGSVDFTNVGSDDRHWLLVRRSAFPAGCPVRL